MSEENELLSLKKVYDELWDDAKNLVKDLTASISLYKYSGILLLFLTIYPIQTLYLWAFIIPQHMINDGIIFTLISYTIALGLLVFFGLKLLRTYFKLKKRYSKLWDMKL